MTDRGWNKSALNRRREENDMDEWSHPVFATREEFEQRIKDVIAAEQEGELEWWYLSFATEEEFLGGLYIPAHGVVEGAHLAYELGLNPGGEVAGWPCVSTEEFDKNVPPADRMRLLTKEEMMKRGGMEL